MESSIPNMCKLSSDEVCEVCGVVKHFARYYRSNNIVQREHEALCLVISFNVDH
jgi:hypothetical protein